MPTRAARLPKCFQVKEGEAGEGVKGVETVRFGVTISEAALWVSIVRARGLHNKSLPGKLSAGRRRQTTQSQSQPETRTRTDNGHR